MTSTVPATIDEAHIRELVTGQEAAMRARDAEWLASRYAPEAVTFTLAPPLRNADVLDADWLRTWFSGFAGPIDFEVRDLTVTAGEDVAFCHSLNRLSATPQGSPEGFELWFRATVGLRKVDGAWRITHEHTSTPFYMDGSFASAVDLTP
ncbi:MAG TPA: nuclear transport factor 2 family protein [Actinophytocola sp.]|uniref:YybH family protein n=1 Tax=Actinophytocola sp. TaxID=1872138 RepID=UPI002DDCEC2C|nr:nuclear transport factor 2 family protein [Actinophytocola sp.]HEV2783937.1 nuclear transport factor 2 family protein [Actinophytocola sp.]